MTYRPVHQLMPINGAVSFQGRKGHGSVFDVPEHGCLPCGQAAGLHTGMGRCTGCSGEGRSFPALSRLLRLHLHRQAEHGAAQHVQGVAGGALAGPGPAHVAAVGAHDAQPGLPAVAEGDVDQAHGLCGRGAAGARDVLCSLERLSEHPLAEAVALLLAESRRLQVDGFESITGRGVCGSVGGRRYYAGNRRLLDETGVSVAPQLLAVAAEYEKRASTVVWFADEERALAVLAVADRMKPGSAGAVAELRRRGIEVVMLTGDNEAAARETARLAGIGRFHAGVLPHEKAEYVARLQSEGRRVAMVGDGINDSAALARADLSIAMGRGSDIAMETAMVTILSSDLAKIPELMRLSQLTVRTIRENLFWAFFYNAVSVPVAAGVLYPLCGFMLDPMIGAAAMAFSSVSVVLNSLRLKRRGGAAEKISGPCGPAAEEMSATEKIITMKKEYRIKGMMCGHCRAHVERALNGIEGVKAVVTLDPPVAVVEFEGGALPLSELQRAVSENAGDYELSE